MEDVEFRCIVHRPRSYTDYRIQLIVLKCRLRRRILQLLILRLFDFIW